MSNQKGSLSIHSENIFPIIKKWLYSDHDIFIRELISNASDAMTKLKKLISLGEAKLTATPDYRVDILLDSQAKTLTIRDNGIGMTEDEVKKYINQIAFSGAEDFLQQYKDKEDIDQIIGHFGLGFYSAFMVASTVDIQTLSYQEGASPVKWSCDGGINYEMTDGSRQNHGTDIILHISEDGEEFLNEWALKSKITKYCSFMPYPIYLTDVNAEPEKDDDGQPIEAEEKMLNTPQPLYTKKPSDCSDDDYKTFYQQTFADFKEPLFWIHLNMDYPFRLKGILYFPRLNNEFDTIEGQIKLYNSQVFIADNIKEVIPEFLLLLKGVIDCPDLPLNVSRSFLQNDGFVKKISDYISKKVADKLNSLFKKERTDSYEKFWADIHPFIKFGCLKDEKFYDKVKDIILYKTLDGNYLTLNEYLAEQGFDTQATEDTAESATDNSSDVTTDTTQTSDSPESEEKPERKIYYYTDARLQANYIQLFKSHELNAIELNHNIDQPFISHVEMRENGLKFLRIDSDLTGSMKSDEKISESVLQSMSESLEKLFKQALSKEALNLKVESLKSDEVSGMILLSEESRRMHDMSKMYGFMGMGMDNLPSDETLILNKNNALVKYLLENPTAPEEDTNLFCQQIYDLAMMSHKPLEAEQMSAFIRRSNSILEKLLPQKK